MTKEKYALLDTDFISKTHLIRKDDQNKMIDRIMEMHQKSTNRIIISTAIAITITCITKQIIII